MNEIEKKEKVNNAKELSKGQILKIISDLPPGSNITFTGGELFLKKDIAAILCEASQRHNITLASNGSLLGDYAELVVKNGISAVGISLDGPPDIHEHIRSRKGLYEKLKTSLDKVNQAKRKNGSHTPQINFNSIILKDNYQRLPEVVKFVKDLGGNSCSFQIYDPSLERSGISLLQQIDYDHSPLCHNEEIDPADLKPALTGIVAEARNQKLEIRFLPALNTAGLIHFYQKQFALDDWQCFFPWTTMRVSPYGDVYPCLNYRIGNVANASLKDLWNSPRYVKFRTSLRQRKLFNACIGCCKMVPLR